ncbi:MAG TPA: response regulator, partial [Thermoanaerobaculia bacterium]|nr:response regulator [Thermoanaerobaculia bacterium]
GGLGLGLSISKTLVEMHGGRLTAASEGWGRGALFTVRLPLPEPGELEAEEAADPMAEAPVPRPAAAPARPLSILLVEDHPDTAAALADLLRAAGHQVTVRGTVAEGKAAADEVYAAGGGFDLLLSDLGLPDGTGLELMRHLGGCYALPGIALSGYGMDEDLQASREAGFSRHLVKPVDLSTLMAAIGEVAAAKK